MTEQELKDAMEEFDDPRECSNELWPEWYGSDDMMEELDRMDGFDDPDDHSPEYDR